MDEPLLIVGASVRAAAMSARRAGFLPFAIDMFGDRDLQAVADTIRSHNYPHDIADLAKFFPPAPWMYLGTIDNRLDIIDAISASRPLWGNHPDTLNIVRDPFRVESILGAHGLPFAHCQPARGSRRGKLLVKPIAGGGGIGIRSAETATDVHGETEFLQEFVSGTPYSATFIGCNGTAELIGFSRQLIGMHSQPVSRFAFCGLISPIDLPDSVAETMLSVGSTLARDADLRGVFGCDFILHDDEPITIEVNPRYTASIELFERCGAPNVFRAHIDACRGRRTHGRGDFTRRGIKLVLYAQTSFEAPDLGSFLRTTSRGEFPRLADIPPRGQYIERGHPICTVLADGANSEDILRQAEEALDTVAGHLPHRSVDRKSIFAEFAEIVRDNLS